VAVPKGKVLAVCCGRYTKTVLDSDPATAITHENGTVYTANSRTAFQRYDVRTNTLGTPLRIPQGAAQALAFRGDDIWAIYPVDRLLRRFNATTGKQVGMPISLPRAPADIAASADGIWILNQDGTVSRIKP
jgi:DNA-binding beta-propeller fold protein YncE